jgi:hypothetical protein
MTVQLSGPHELSAVEHRVLDLAVAFTTFRKQTG